MVRAAEGEEGARRLINPASWVANHYDNSDTRSPVAIDLYCPSNHMKGIEQFWSCNRVPLEEAIKKPVPLYSDAGWRRRWLLH